jgi:two-component system response regulator HydG
VKVPKEVMQVQATPGLDAIRVLLIEDHPDVAEMTKLMLELLGCRVTHSPTLADARARLADTPVDLLLADYRLPDGTGLEAVRLAEDAVVRVLLTGYDREDTQMTADDRVRCRVVTKPIDMDQAQQLIDEVRRCRAA